MHGRPRVGSTRAAPSARWPRMERNRCLSAIVHHLDRMPDSSSNLVSDPSSPAARLLPQIAYQAAKQRRRGGLRSNC
jgi:hypothetical protein